jgi:hypothetical protein
MKVPVAVSIAAVVMLMGCTTSLTNMSPARTMKQGEGQAALGYQFDVHTQAFTGIYRAGEAAYEEMQNTDEDATISEETLRTVLDAVLLWRLFPLGGGPELMGRIGVYDNLLEGVDVGFRSNGNVFKGDLRLQVWGSADDAAAISVQAAYGHHRSVINSVLEWVALSRWDRRDFDFQVNFGYEVDHFARVYASPRYLLSRVSMDAELSPQIRERLPEQYRDWDPSEVFPTSYLHYMGLNFGGMLGYRYAFVLLDVSVFRTYYRPEILGSERDYGGWVFSPTVGLTLVWR